MWPCEAGKNYSRYFIIRPSVLICKINVCNFCLEIQSNYSDAEISTEVDLASCDSFSLSQSEKIHNPYLTSSVSMRNVIQCDVFSNAVNSNISKRPSSLPIPNQSG